MDASKDTSSVNQVVDLVVETSGIVEAEKIAGEGEASEKPAAETPRRKWLLWVGIGIIGVAILAAIAVAVVFALQKQTPPPPPGPTPPTTPPSPPPPLTTPEPTTTGPSWGSNDVYASLCANEQGDDQYWCNSDCMENCYAFSGANGLLLENDSYKLEYCSSVHAKEPDYNNQVCCCAEYIPYFSAADKEEVVPCLGGAKPRQACDTWCLLHSERLLPGTSTDCDPGFSYCLPFGEAADDCDLPIECSDELLCCCDIFT